MEYCLIRRSLERGQNGEVFAVRNIWNATPVDAILTQTVLQSMADKLTEGTTDPTTDYVVCEGSFDSVLDAYNQSRKVSSG